MAEVVPAQVVRAAALLAVLLTGCSKDEPTPQQDPAASGQPEAPRGRTRQKEPPPKTPEEAIARIRKRCHGILESDTGMASCSVQLRDDENDEVPEDVKLGPDSCMSITLRDKSKKILSDTGKGWHIVRGEQTEIDPIEGVELEQLRQFQRLLRTALLEPLYECEKARQKGPNAFEFTTKAGETWQLDLREVDPPDEPPVLLPHTLSGPPGTVTFEEHLHTGVTHLPKRVVLGDAGRRLFSLELSGLSFARSVFADPVKHEKPKVVFVQTGGFTPDPPIGEVGTKIVPARTALVLPDPGDWQARYELLNVNGRLLAKQGQQTADLDFLFDEGGKRYVAMPFEPLPKDLGGKPFVKAKDQRILKLPKQNVVLVYPKNGTIEKNEKIAKTLLDAFLKENELRAAGPMRIIPWIQIDEPLPPERVLQRLRIGFELPVTGN